MDPLHQKFTSDLDDTLWIKEEAEVVTEEEAVSWFSENLNVDINQQFKMDVEETEITELPTTDADTHDLRYAQNPGHLSDHNYAQDKNNVLENSSQRGNYNLVDNSQVSRVVPHTIKLKGKERLKAKRTIRLTRSGRQVKPTSKILTFEDEALQAKQQEISTELDRLKKIAAHYCPEEYKKYENRPSTTLSHETTSLEKQNMSQNNSKTITTNQDFCFSGIQSSQASSTDLYIYIQARENCGDERNPAIVTQEKSSVIQENVANTNKHCDSHNESECRLHSNVDQNLRKILASLQTLEDQKKLIIEQNNTIINRNAQILELFKRNSINDPTSLYEPLSGFPLATIEEFNKFNEEKNSELLQKMHTYLLHLGGSKTRDFLHYALKALMTDKLVCKFSWLGSKKTQSFGDTKLSNLMYMSAKKCPNFVGPNNKWQYKTEMNEVFRTTKQRYRHCIKKSDEELMSKIARLEENLTTIADVI